MPWVWPRESTSAAGVARITPLAVEMSTILGVVNGHMDRDNVSMLKWTSKPSVIAVGTASKMHVFEGVVSTTPFTLYDGRSYVETADLEFTSDDCVLTISAIGTLRLKHSDIAVLTEQELDIGFGLEVDGELAYHTGMLRYRVEMNDADEFVMLPRAIDVALAVGAGPHIVRLFWDAAYHAAYTLVSSTGVGTGAPIGSEVPYDRTNLDTCSFYEHLLIVQEHRR